MSIWADHPVNIPARSCAVRIIGKSHISHGSNYEGTVTAARCFLTPSESAANAIKWLTQDVVLDVDGTTGADYKTIVDILESQNRAIFEGDLRCVEAMLLDQSHVLQSIFMFYTQKMSSAVHIEQIEALGRIALRSQNQCRQTLATLIELKNPKRATFIKQQNNAVNQQIN